MYLKRFIPPGYCEKCDVCCRFLDDETPIGLGLSLISYQDRFICCNFDPASNRCKDYENRPLDCQLYPFVIMWDEKYRKVVLGVDQKCLYINKSEIRNPQSEIMSKFQAYKNYLLSTLKDIESKYILRFQDDIQILSRLDIKAELQLNRLLIGDRALFEKYTSQNERPISSHSFIANYIWTGLLDYSWMIIDDNLCLFCKTKETIFMPVPPLGKKLSEQAVRESFSLMNKYNKNKDYSRIEEIAEGNLGFFEDLGYKIIKKGYEYIYRRKDLVDLAGDKYKAKRALCNYFKKNYKFDIRKFEPNDKEECLELFKRWARERIKKGTLLSEKYPQADESYYKALVEDSYQAHKKAMERFQDLGLVGLVVVVDKGIAAYTFGYQLDDEVLVVLSEIADLKIKGLAQFIFREFCAMGGRELVNVMDDSGLENLKRVKVSYHPVRIERTFCAYA